MPAPTIARLTAKQRAFLDHYAHSGHLTNAGIAAGYTARSAPQMGKRILENPLAIEYLRALRDDTRAIVAYDLATAMRESLEVIDFAKEKGNAMAYFKAVEHRAKLSGLLVERVQVSSVDITAALDEAQARVEVHVIPHIDIQPRIISVNSEQVDNTAKDGSGQLTQWPLSDVEVEQHSQQADGKTESH